LANLRRRRRRNHIRRRRRDAGGGVVLPILLCVVLTPLAILVAITVFFRVSTISVTGDSGYEESDILKASGIKVGDNMFRFNKFESIENIFDEMPYIDEISIRRHLPDDVEIIVSRCIPVAALQNASSWYLIDAKGKILENIGENQPDGYPVIVGAELEDPKVGEYVKFIDKEKEKPLFLVLNTSINSDILQYIDNIDVDRVYNIKFTYKGRFTVNIGDSEQIDKKIRFMLLMAEEKLSADAVGTIDVSDATTARFIPE